LKKTYQIDKQRAAQEFRERARAVMDPLQLAIPLAEVMALVQQGLMSLALDVFTQLAEQMMEVGRRGVGGPQEPDQH